MPLQDFFFRFFILSKLYYCINKVSKFNTFECLTFVMHTTIENYNGVDNLTLFDDVKWANHLNFRLSTFVRRLMIHR